MSADDSNSSMEKRHQELTARTEAAREKVNATRDKWSDIGQRIQEKFDYYLVALAFTVLGFSIQTARPAAWRPANLLEIGAWVAVALAGSVGLVGIQAHANFFRSLSKTPELQSSISAYSEATSRAGQILVRARVVLRWGLVAGLVLLIFSRASDLLMPVRPVGK